ncbi:MAG: hypothetical protein NVS4B12_17660 [Ktedonobacteraceae bacterium]
MRLVEQHCIGKQDPRYAVIDAACFASKKLYNYANYIVRQSFIHDHIYKGYAVVYHEVKHSDAYKAFPAKLPTMCYGCSTRIGSPSLRQ